MQSKTHFSSSLGIKQLYLRNFRNFNEISLNFSEGINVFHGLNAQGKTNLLEAISLLSLGRSFRTHHLHELIKDHSSFFFLEAHLIRNEISQVVRISFDGQNKSIECNTTRYTSFQALLGLIPSVFFTPQDSDLISGSPAIRRRFLNLHLAQSDPLYVHHLVRFWRAVKQRNAILRSSSLEGIQYWEEEMALSAAYLYERRQQFLVELNTKLLAAPALLDTPLKIVYQPSQPIDYLIHLGKNRKREQMLGMTLIGPHRDDFSILMIDKPARLYASEGQRRSIGALLRLAEWERLREQIGAPPLFGVDDFDLHLDPERKKLFQSALEPLGQVFITLPEKTVSWGSSSFLIHAGELRSS